MILLFASLFFYAAGEGILVLILFLCIYLNYILGMSIERAGETGRAKLHLAFGIAANLSLLFIFKYSGFFYENTNHILGTFGLAIPFEWNIHMPIGISFFTFQSMSYIIDIYRKAAPSQRNLSKVALYISFFPQLIAGPIVRYQSIVGQLVQRTVTRECFLEGISRFIIGLGKKKIIADTLALEVDKIFSLQVDYLTTGTAWVGAIYYSLQIFYDFSGYSDMAIGLGQMFGFQLPENFNYPYISRSVREFWRRWHITLSAWFRDYLYVPMGGGRRSRNRVYFNLITVFLLCGFWHGAEWKFLFWGFFHGTFIILERGGLSRMLNACPKVVGHLYMLLVIIIGWVIFRADSLPHAGSFISAMAGFAQGNGDIFTITEYTGIDTVLVLIAAIIGSGPVLPRLQKASDIISENMQGSIKLIFAGMLYFFKVTVLAGIALICALLIAAGTYTPFIYSRF